MKAIADTGLLVAMVRENDQYHDWAAEVAEQISWPVLTCEAVLAETAFHLHSSQEVVGMLRDNIVRVAFDCESEMEHLYALATRYADRNPDLADVCLIRMSELYPRHQLVTTDQDDFRVYRRNKREAIPLLCPPKR
ncbi:MAG TPA: PIN domain-containing protein [Bryobacteraceae bacterium]|nr:PIN domain-containing protein [Bryobacteraceae bacterium]